MVRNITKPPLTFLLILSFIFLVIGNEQLTYPQSIDKANSQQQVNDLASTENTSNTLLWVALGLAAVSLVAYIVINVSKSNGGENAADSTNNKSSSIILQKNSNSTVSKLYNKVKQISQKFPFYITAGIRRDNMNPGGKLFFLNVKYLF